MQYRKIGITKKIIETIGQLVKYIYDVEYIVRNTRDDFLKKKTKKKTHTHTRDEEY